LGLSNDGLNFKTSLCISKLLIRFTYMQIDHMTDFMSRFRERNSSSPRVLADTVSFLRSME
jgi:hypothetical protein